MSAKVSGKPTSGAATALFPKFRCNYPNCSFAVRRMALLKNHMRNHSQEKPFKCRFCSYSTQSRSNCKVHEQRMHTFQRPHKCHYCVYSCVQSTTLRQHVQMKHKERCQYRCFRCPNFHCQRESQLMYHLLKVHQTTAITEISPYLNPNYIPDHMLPISNLPPTATTAGPPAPGEFPAVSQMSEDQRIFGLGSGASSLSSGQQLQQQQQQQQQQAEVVRNQPHQNRRYSATPYKLVRASNDLYSANTSVAASQDTQRVTVGQGGSVGTVANTNAATWPAPPPAAAAAGKKGATQLRREQHPKRQASLNDLTDHCLLTSSSLIAPLDDGPEVIEIGEGEEELGRDKPVEAGIYVCNQCLMSFHDEGSFMNHLMSSHPSDGEGEQEEGRDAEKEAAGQPQEAVGHQEALPSSSGGLGFSSFPTVVEASSVAVSLGQGEFAAPAAIKQEGGGLSMALLGQDGWPTVPVAAPAVAASSHTEDRSDAGVQRRAESEATAEGMVSPGVQTPATTTTMLRGRSTSVASQESLGASARAGTPLLDMPSPTTTHLANATASTQTPPLSAAPAAVGSSSSSRAGGPSPSSLSLSPSPAAKFCCAHCSIVFPDSVLFAIHRGAHGFHSPFECNYCGKDCGNKYEFASHLHNCS